MHLAYRIIGITAWALGSLGLVCLLLGGYLASQTHAFARDAAHATATVKGYREIPDGDDTRYYPALRFKTATGEIVKVHGQLAPTTKRFAIGAEVPVVYRVGNPMEARIDLFTDNWLGATIALVLAAASFFAAWLLARSARRARAAAA